MHLVMIARSDISACMGCIGNATRKAARAVSSVYDRSLAPHGIRITQFTILATLELRGATALGELAKFLELDRTTLTRNLELLEEKNWVQSRAAPNDSRSRILSLTNEGRTLVVSAFPAWREAQEHVAAAIGGSDLALLTKLTEILHRH
jgi:DNA-binding MarR family transcriptional regulator